MKKFKKAIATSVIAFFIIVISSCNTPRQQDGWHQFSGSTMGTTYHITTSGLELAKAQSITDSVLLLVNSALSTYDSSSFISRFNRSELDSFKTSRAEISKVELFKDVWDASKLNYQISGGAFDPSASPLFKLWGFAEKSRNGLPSNQEIQNALKLVGFNDSLFPNYKKTNALSNLNFNAIAKGYGVDKVAESLRHFGAQNVMVEIGGEVMAFGNNQKGEAWKLGINKPDEGAPADDFIHVVSLSNQAMATSGNYRNFFYHAGKKYSHTIDPRTGYPIENELLSVSIIAKNCTTADALATACMVMGLDASTKLIESLLEVNAFFVIKEKNVLKVIQVAGEK